jgi:integrase
LAASRRPIEIGASRTIEGTVNALVAAYLDCTEKSSSPFKTFAPETQRTHRNILENFRNQHGDKRIFHTEANGRRVMFLKREHLQRIVNEKAATPFGQRNFLNTLHRMFDWAVGEGRVPENPTLGVKRQKAKTTGYKTWTEADIERFEAKHAIGTKGRLAFALLLYTGQRRGDVVKMGPHNIHRGVLTVDQRKTEGNEESHIEIPVHPRLTAIIETTPTVWSRPARGCVAKLS